MPVATATKIALGKGACFLVVFLLAYPLMGQRPSIEIPVFQHVVVDSIFRSESATTADFNQDGSMDILIGDIWYEAPDWIPHEIRTPGDFLSSTYSDNKPTDRYHYYSNSFAVQALDVNSDGWSDALVYPVMNQPILCYVNPGLKKGHWALDTVVSRYHGESPLLVNLWEDQTLGALAGVHRKDSLFHLCYLLPSDESSWQIRELGTIEQSKYRGPGWDKMTKWFAAGSRDHGLGVGDLNGDGNNDIVTRHGWYQGRSKEEQEPWTFHEFRFDSLVSPEFPHYQFAQMPVFDIDQDGDNDIFCSSAHQYGLWWMENTQSDSGLHFTKHPIPFSMSQGHAVALGDLNKNGIGDIVVGKRYLAHNGNDPGWNDPLHLLWMEPSVRDGRIEWQISVIHTGVGVGTQIELKDIDGDTWADIIVSNKKGTHIFLQDRTRP